MCELLQKIELLHAAGTQIVPADGEAVVKTLYEILNILDSKGLALLAFDGIVVAATTFAAEKGDVFRKRGVARWLAIAVIVVALTAAGLCLGVSEISYPFLHFVDCTAADTLDLSAEMKHLVSVIDWRTAYYQIAWSLSIIAMPLFLAMFWVSLDWSKRG